MTFTIRCLNSLDTKVQFCPADRTATFILMRYCCHSGVYFSGRTFIEIASTVLNGRIWAFLILTA